MDLMLENQFIKLFSTMENHDFYFVCIWILYPGLPVGEPTELGEPRFSTMEIQK